MANTIINPDSQTYKSFIFDDSYGLSFQSSLGAYADLFIREDIVETDESILPY